MSGACLWHIAKVKKHPCEQTNLCFTTAGPRAKIWQVKYI